MRSRRWLFALLLALFACESPNVVDCGSTGRFVVASGDPWCIYARSSTMRCPRLVPVEHTLAWGRGCAATRHDPLPPDLCAAAGHCAADAGVDGGGT